jgi:hypothetical protein
MFCVPAAGTFLLFFLMTRSCPSVPPVRHNTGKTTKINRRPVNIPPTTTRASALLRLDPIPVASAAGRVRRRAQGHQNRPHLGIGPFNTTRRVSLFDGNLQFARSTRPPESRRSVEMTQPRLKY